ncbi:unnamed protein product [Prorocentrum cordatum]|uniref:Uncharacterized protein n=1 Tax=Prorocentrum cordatum TaxID=2364126 RepID=A0ABN9X7E6_9DINO|nr:unnamed protein product [Polarella glacialis]
MATGAINAFSLVELWGEAGEGEASEGEEGEASAGARGPGSGGGADAAPPPQAGAAAGRAAAGSLQRAAPRPRRGGTRRIEAAAEQGGLVFLSGATEARPLAAGKSGVEKGTEDPPVSVGQVKDLWRNADLGADVVTKSQFLQPEGLASQLVDSFRHANVPAGPVDVASLPKTTPPVSPVLEPARPSRRSGGAGAGPPGVEALIAMGFPQTMWHTSSKLIRVEAVGSGCSAEHFGWAPSAWTSKSAGCTIIFGRPLRVTDVVDVLVPPKSTQERPGSLGVKSGKIGIVLSVRCPPPGGATEKKGGPTYFGADGVTNSVNHWFISEAALVNALGFKESYCHGRRFQLIPDRRFRDNCPLLPVLGYLLEAHDGKRKKNNHISWDPQERERAPELGSWDFESAREDRQLDDTSEFNKHLQEAGQAPSG